MLDQVLSRFNGIEMRLAAIEQRVGMGPDTGDLDQQIAQVRSEKELAIDANELEQAVSLREQEKELLAQKATREQEWAAAPGLADLAEVCQYLSHEIERLHALLRQTALDRRTGRHDRPAQGDVE